MTPCCVFTVTIMCADTTSTLTNTPRLIIKFYMWNHLKSRVTPLKLTVLNKSQDAVNEGSWVVQPNKKMNGTSLKTTSITFGIGFIYVLCRTGLQLDYIALVSCSWGEGKSYNLAIILFFDWIQNLRFKNILVWSVCWNNLVSDLSNDSWMLSPFA